MLLRKLLTKLFQRIGIAFLPPTVAKVRSGWLWSVTDESHVVPSPCKWRYDRGKRSLQIGQGDSGAAGGTAQGDAEPRQQDDNDEDDRVVPDEVRSPHPSLSLTVT